MQLQDNFTGFKVIQLHKDQVLGIGSYGKVCRAKCDKLLCAAKLIHETLFDPMAEQLVAPQREHRLPMRRFEQECQFLSTIRHPNIVQYLGIYQDPDTGLPALLMELMDDSLTHFLESSTQPIPYHIAVNICHDIALALSFLHSNDIVHRDLSSNNVLLIGNVRAKVTDFGMARLGELNPRATHLTFTMCPGTDVFMPPEAVRDDPVYTEKIDCFSFGVITLQMLTRKFPKPGDRRRRIQITQPGIPSGTMAEVLIAERERRQNHISEVDPNHPLLQITLDCLKDGAIERPSSQQLCERLAALKESPGYDESAQSTPILIENGETDDAAAELRSQGRRHAQQVQSLQQVIQSQIHHLNEKDRVLNDTIAISQQQIGNQQDVIQRLTVENTRQRNEVEQLRGGIDRMSRQLEENECVISQFQRRITELEQLLLATEMAPKGSEQSESISRAQPVKMTWKEGGRAPVKMSSDYNAVVNDTTVYVRRANDVYAYTVSHSTWSQLPDSPVNDCPSVIVKNLFTLVGGYRDFPNATNQLFSLTGEGGGKKWTGIFPPMPTKRRGSTALCTGTALIVAGGIAKNGSTMKTVEVMDTEILQWFAAMELPQPLWGPPAVVCGDQIYILSLRNGSKSMYTCSVSALIQSCWSKPTAGVVWNRIAAPPVTDTTCVSIHGRLLTIGGMDSIYKPVAAVYIYVPITDSWEVISRLVRARSSCFAALLPNNQLMVVGGRTATDSVEIATIE